MARAVGISHTSVQNIWRAHGLKPHLVDSFKVSNDPAFAEKVEDVVGLYLDFTFRFNRRFYPFNAFRSLLGIAGDTSAPTYAELYSGEWRHPTCSGHGR